MRIVASELFNGLDFHISYLKKFPICCQKHLRFNVQRSTVTAPFLEGNFKYGKSLNLYIAATKLYDSFRARDMLHVSLDGIFNPKMAPRRGRLQTLSKRSDKNHHCKLHPKRQDSGSQMTRRFQRDTETNYALVRRVAHDPSLPTM